MPFSLARSFSPWTVSTIPISFTALCRCWASSKTGSTVKIVLPKVEATNWPPRKESKRSLTGHRNTEVPTCSFSETYWDKDAPQITKVSRLTRSSHNKTSVLKQIDGCDTKPPFLRWDKIADFERDTKPPIVKTSQKRRFCERAKTAWNPFLQSAIGQLNEVEWLVWKVWNEFLRRVIPKICQLPPQGVQVLSDFPF